MDKQHQVNFWYVVAAIIGMVLLQLFLAETRKIEVIPYSEFQNYVRQGRIERITVGDTHIRGTLREALPDGRREFYTVRVEPGLAKDLEFSGVTFTGELEDTWLSRLLGWLMPMILFVGIWMFLIRGWAEKQGMGTGGFMSVGRSKAKIYVEKDIKVTFEDVAGIDEAKVELKEIVDFLKRPSEFGRLGARVPKGVLLVGPPGTGKTLAARAIAGEAGVPFFHTNGSEFVEMFVGVGAARVRDLFEQARKSAPCIIFIDELDALGRARSSYPGFGGHDEKEQTLNQLLAELDGFDPSSGIVLLAATNRPEILDPALLRAGRFDRQILIDRPDKLGRVQILKVHVRKVQLAGDVQLEQVAALTPGFSGADLANLVNEAAVIATRRSGGQVTMDDFTAAIERIVAGLEKKSRLLIPREREMVAYHEMGHALVALAIPGSDPVHKVSIIPRGIGSLGYTIQRPTEDRFLMSRSELENKMAVLLGGRAAEQIVFDEHSTGAADDLAKVTDIARGMVMRYGMNVKLGPIAYDTELGQYLGQQGQEGAFWRPRRYSEETAREIDCAVRELVNAALGKAVDILQINRAQLEKGARELLARETMLGEELPRPRPFEPQPRIAAARG
jgi:cell division protease FtsH